LLIDSDLACFSWPSAPNASSSKKQRIVLSERRKYSSALFSWSFVVKMPCATVGSNSSTICAARARSAAMSWADLKSGMTMVDSGSMMTPF